MPYVKAGSPGTAKLLVVLLAFAWGLNWIAAAVALREVSPWALRVAGSSIGAVTLLAAAIITGHRLRIPRGEFCMSWWPASSTSRRFKSCPASRN